MSELPRLEGVAEQMGSPAQTGYRERESYERYALLAKFERSLIRPAD